MNKFGVNLSKADQEKMLTQGEIKLKKYKAAISSMTKKEKVKPDLLNPSRKRRVAKGCGQKEKDIDQMVVEFKQMKKMMDGMKPLMSMMKGQGSMPMPNPSMFTPGGAKMGNGFQAPRGGLLKGFKPKKK